MAKFCVNCGHPVGEDSLFCENCGAKTYGTQNKTQQSQHDSQQDNIQQSRNEHQRNSTQQYNDSYDQSYDQPRAQHYSQHTSAQPYQSTRQNNTYAQYGAPRQPEKKNGAVIALIIAVVVFLAAAITVFLLVIKPLLGAGNTAPTETATATEAISETEEPAEEPTEALTEAPTEAPAEAPTEAPAELPYINSIGGISASDFAWISDAASGSLDGDLIGQNDFVGKWKAEYIFDGVWELVYITIDFDGNITVEPYQINYGEGWENESSDGGYSLSGSFDVGGINASGIYGNMSLYMFKESYGTQYGLGYFTVQSGEKAEVYLVRP